MKTERVIEIIDEMIDAEKGMINPLSSFAKRGMVKSSIYTLEYLKKMIEEENERKNDDN
jgi:hypothetical protein